MGKNPEKTTLLFLININVKISGNIQFRSVQHHCQKLKSIIELIVLKKVGEGLKG